MVKHAVFFAPGHKREADEIGKHRAQAIESIKPQQRVFLREVEGNQVLANGCETLSQFLSIPSISAIAKRAEPLVAVCLADDCARPDHFPALAAPVTRSTDVI